MAKSHPRWRMVKKTLTLLFFIAVAALLVVYAQKIDWHELLVVILVYNTKSMMRATGLDTAN